MPGLSSLFGYNKCCGIASSNLNVASIESSHNFSSYCRIDLRTKSKHVQAMSEQPEEGGTGVGASVESYEEKACRGLNTWHELGCNVFNI